jgi:uncharacterized protein (TIGR02598 family)
MRFTLPDSRPRPVARRAGFTLAEVLLAMGVFVFAALALVGTLPNGLAALQQARAKAAETRITRHLGALYQAELDRAGPALISAVLSRLAQPALYQFDERGDPVRAAVNTDMETSLGARARLRAALPLPGESAPSPFVARLEIRITERWRDEGAFVDPRRHRAHWWTVVLRAPVPPGVSLPATED